jgi:hypothetical protein
MACFSIRCWLTSWRALPRTARRPDLGRIRKLLWAALVTEKMAKTLGWALISGLLFFFSGIMGVGWEHTAAMLLATLTCVALKTPVYWAYEHGWEWAFSPRSAKHSSTRKKDAKTCSCASCTAVS